MQSEIRMRPNLAQMNAKKVQIDHLSKENEELQGQNTELHNEIMQLRNQTQTHLTDNGGFHGTSLGSFGNQSSILDSVIPSSTHFNSHTKSDARLVLDEICQILSLPDNDAVVLLDTVRKLERVVKAVPRMEQFIHNLSIAMSDDEQKDKALPLEQIMPRLNLWKEIVQHSQMQLQPLLQLKVDITKLLLGQPFEISET